MNDQYSITGNANRSFQAPSLIDELVESGEDEGGALDWHAGVGLINN